MCENIFKNQEERKRKEDFTKLFASLINNAVASTMVASNIVNKAGK